MTAYALSLVDVTDPDAFRPYAERVAAVVARHGGRYLSIDDSPVALEGLPAPGTVVLVAFDDVAAARRWYESEDYRAIAPIRRRSADTTVILFEGSSPASRG